MRNSKAASESSESDPDGVMLWAACCLAFFGFLCTGEMTVPNNSAFTAVHLIQTDMAAKSPAAPTMLKISIKQSKTDPFMVRVNVLLGKT